MFSQAQFQPQMVKPAVSPVMAADGAAEQRAVHAASKRMWVWKTTQDPERLTDVSQTSSALTGWNELNLFPLIELRFRFTYKVPRLFSFSASVLLENWWTNTNLKRSSGSLHFSSNGSFSSRHCFSHLVRLYRGEMDSGWVPADKSWCVGQLCSISVSYTCLTAVL